ncbi:MAG: diguanylate cyclase domain-containing protein [Candidatus Helarchaeota archaeon]
MDIKQINKTLDDLKISNDSKWRFLFLYITELMNSDILYNSQKDFHKLITETIENKDFSDERFNYILKEKIETYDRVLSNQSKLILEESIKSLKKIKDTISPKEYVNIKVEEITLNEIRKILENKTDLNLIEETIKNVFDRFVQSFDSNSKFVISNNIDSITGLENKHKFLDTFPILRKECLNNKTSLFLLMIKIDDLRYFINKFNLVIGNQVIKTVSKLITKSLNNKKDIKSSLFKYDVDKFLLSLIGTSKNQSLEIAESIKSNVHDYNFLIRKSDKSIIEEGSNLTVSVGISKIDTKNELSFKIINDLVNTLDKEKQDGKRNLVRYC